MSQRKVIFVVGSTASGKSDWALKLAQKYDGVIVNCDSVQVYQYVDIGSAKPSIEEQKLVPHYLLDYVAPPEESTAGNYARDFYRLIDSIPEEKPLFVVGGTGFYFQAIEKGMYPVIQVEESLKQQIAFELSQNGGAQKLYSELEKIDPEYSKKIHVADIYRLGRAIELVRSQGKSITQIQQEFESQRKPFPFPLLKMGPHWDKDELRERIVIRTQKMLQLGLLQEVRGLLDKGLKDWAPVKSVGYKECVDFLEGLLPESELSEKIVTNTYQLAKRQKTWFQRDKDIHWFKGNSEEEPMRALVEEFLIT